MKSIQDLSILIVVNFSLLVPLLAITIFLGIYPRPFFGYDQRDHECIDRSSCYSWRYSRHFLACICSMSNLQSLSLYWPELILSGTILLAIIIDIFSELQQSKKVSNLGHAGTITLFNCSSYHQAFSHHVIYGYTGV
ncbi:MAG: hypothetical protein CM1200mP10_15360 [Candidatus Neomarinimicrobiota bacterium]|nr:MAG: hypothetical protein CM1200mP10_15360 [Candidatus Neomarinimicrobiota bacterium]